MESTQTIKRRIRAVNNTAQITKAMEMVSANKMRRSQETALASRPYATAALHLLKEISKRSAYPPSLMAKRDIKNTLIILVAADKGLAGSLNSNIFRRFEKELRAMEQSNAPQTFKYLAVGKKSEEFLKRKGVGIVKSFVHFGDYVETEETEPLAEFIIAGFRNHEWDEVIVFSTHFRTTLRQDVLIRNLLPVTYLNIEATAEEITPEYGKFAGGTKSAGFIAQSKPTLSWEYLIEPSPEEVLENLTEHLVEMEIYHLILEANASEHSARMVAMKNASDNATDLKNELSLLYNKSRQSGITREISEISAGAESLESNK